MTLLSENYKYIFEPLPSPGLSPVGRGDISNDTKATMPISQNEKKKKKKKEGKKEQLYNDQNLFQQLEHRYRTKIHGCHSVRSFLISITITSKRHILSLLHQWREVSEDTLSAHSLIHLSL